MLGTSTEGLESDFGAPNVWYYKDGLLSLVLFLAVRKERWQQWEEIKDWGVDVATDPKWKWWKAPTCIELIIAW